MRIGGGRLEVERAWEAERYHLLRMDGVGEIILPLPSPLGAKQLAAVSNNHHVDDSCARQCPFNESSDAFLVRGKNSVAAALRYIVRHQTAVLQEFLFHRRDFPGDEKPAEGDAAAEDDQRCNTCQLRTKGALSEVIEQHKVLSPCLWRLITLVMLRGKRTRPSKDTSGHANRVW